MTKVNDEAVNHRLKFPIRNEVEHGSEWNLIAEAQSSFLAFIFPFKIVPQQISSEARNHQAIKRSCFPLLCLKHPVIKLQNSSEQHFFSAPNCFQCPDQLFTTARVIRTPKCGRKLGLSKKVDENMIGGNYMTITHRFSSRKTRMTWLNVESRFNLPLS